MQTPLIPVLKLTVQLTLNNDKSRSNLKKKAQGKTLCFYLCRKKFHKFPL